MATLQDPFDIPKQLSDNSQKSIGDLINLCLEQCLDTAVGPPDYKGKTANITVSFQNQIDYLKDAYIHDFTKQIEAAVAAKDAECTERVRAANEAKDAECKGKVRDAEAAKDAECEGKVRAAVATKDAELEQSKQKAILEYQENIQKRHEARLAAAHGQVADTKLTGQRVDLVPALPPASANGQGAAADTVALAVTGPAAAEEEEEEEDLTPQGVNKLKKEGDVGGKKSKRQKQKQKRKKTKKLKFK